MPSRWMHNGLQLVTSAAMLTVSSAVAGWVGMVRPMAEGVAGMHAAGEFSGPTDLLYTCEIDSVAAGKGIGEATFRWKTADSSGWEATGVLTAAIATTLDNGVSVLWTAGGGGDQFAVGDKWTFFGLRLYGKARLLDMDPDTHWEATGNTDETITIDLGAAQTPTVLWLGDHNFTSGATITLMGHTADAWGSPSYSQAVTYSAPHCCLFLDETYRYWRVRVQDSGNADNIQVANLHHGTYWEPGTRDYARGYKKNASYPRKRLRVLGPKARSWLLDFTAAPEADREGLEALWDAVHDWANQRVRPAIVCPDSSDPTDTALVLPASEFNQKQDFRTNFSLRFPLTELPRTVT